jgi:hypothetical protein
MKMNTMTVNHLTKRTGTELQTSWRDNLEDGFRASCAGAMVRRRFRLWPGMRCEVQTAADRSDAILAYSLQRGGSYENSYCLLLYFGS